METTLTSWRPELVYEELEDADNLDQPVRQVLQSCVLVIDSATGIEANTPAR
jgi:hypothetical protein